MRGTSIRKSCKSLFIPPLGANQLITSLNLNYCLKGKIGNGKLGYKTHIKSEITEAL